MDGVNAITVLRGCFPAITTVQAEIAEIELRRFADGVGLAAVERYVRANVDFSVARFITCLHEVAGRGSGPYPSDIPATAKLEKRLQLARDEMLKMPEEELDQLKRKCFENVQSPLRERLLAIPALESRSVKILVADKLFPER